MFLLIRFPIFDFFVVVIDFVDLAMEETMAVRIILHYIAVLSSEMMPTWNNFV